MSVKLPIIKKETNTHLEQKGSLTQSPEELEPEEIVEPV